MSSNSNNHHHSTTKKRPCRLTVGSPNTAAKELLQKVTAELEERSFGKQYGCVLCWGTMGAVFLVTVMATTGAAAGAFMVFASCVAMGVLYHTKWRQDDTSKFDMDDEGINKARVVLSVRVEERIEEDLEKQRACLFHLQGQHQQQGTKTLRDIMATVVPTKYQQVMNYVGSVPESALASYALAWTALCHQTSMDPILPQVHVIWIELVGVSLEWAAHVVGEMDQKRLVARRQGSLSATEEDGDGDDEENDKGAAIKAEEGEADKYTLYLQSRIQDVQKSLQSISAKDQKDNKASPSPSLRSKLRVNYQSLQARTGPHEIYTQKSLLVGAFVGAVCMVGVFVVAVEGSFKGAMMMWGFSFVAAAVASLLVLRNTAPTNAGLNTLEYLFQVEEMVRFALNDEMMEQINKKFKGQHQELTQTTLRLRNSIMEAYYDTLSIHLETDLMTFGDAPPSPLYCPTPLFGNKQKTTKQKNVELGDACRLRLYTDSSTRLSFSRDSSDDDDEPKDGGSPVVVAKATKQTTTETVYSA